MQRIWGLQLEGQTGFTVVLILVVPLPVAKQEILLINLICKKSSIRFKLL